MVDLPHVTGFHDEGRLGAGLAADEMVVHGRAEQERRNRCEIRGGVTVRQDDEADSGLDEGIDLDEDLFEARFERCCAAVDVVEPRHLGCGEA